MTIKHCILSSLFLVMLMSMQNFAQAQHDHYKCGTTFDEQVALKERMLENRRNKEALMTELETVRAAQRGTASSISYVPVVFHVVAKSDGTGAAPIANVLASVCEFNNAYASQNIQFYIYNINYINNTLLFTNNVNSGNYIMSLHKVPGVVNIFIGGPILTQYLAYYTRQYDWIFSWKTGIETNNIKTLTHELGHYFTLPHTFFGWEGLSYAAEAGSTGKAPAISGNGMPVERVVRAASGENCQLAGDGFCDTPPDYASDRTPCPQNNNWRDPDSILIDPDETNYMSYFFDQCVTGFSNDQAEAILLDFVSRGYHLFETPSPLMATGTPTILGPAQGEIAFEPGSVHLRWQAADVANRYLITINRTINNGTTFIAMERQLYVSGTEWWVSLPANQEYTWTVKAMTQYDVCNSLTSAPVTFRTGTWAVPVTTVSNAVESSRVFPNPSSKNSEMVLEINLTEASDVQVSILNALGQVVLPKQNLTLNAGNNLQHINLSGLAAGLYLVSIDSGNERITHKLLIQE